MHWWALLAATALAPVARSQACLSHDHCGTKAVCVTEEPSGAPQCRCLVGFRPGGGRDCIPNSANLPAQASAVLQHQRTVVLEKCPNASTATGIAAAKPVNPTSAAKVSQKSSPTELNLPQKGSASSDKDKARTLKLPCSPAECDFSDGPCGYQNDYYSEWQLREIQGGTIVLSSGDSKTEHYLLSASFSLDEASLLLFDYFESSLSASHLSVYSRDLASLVWKATGKEAGWQQAVATLPPGRHQIIFAAEKLKPSQLVAITNVRLVNSSGSPAPCF